MQNFKSYFHKRAKQAMTRKKRKKKNHPEKRDSSTNIHPGTYVTTEPVSDGPGSLQDPGQS